MRNHLVSVLDLRKERVFPGVAVRPVVVIVERGTKSERRTRILIPTQGPERLEPQDLRVAGEPLQDAFLRFPQSQIRLDASFGSGSLIERLAGNSVPLSKAFYVNWGLRTGTYEKTERMIAPSPTGANPKPLLRGEDVRERYLIERPPRFIDYLPQELYNPMFPEMFEGPKIVFRKISGGRGLRAVVDRSGAYCFSTLICAVNLANLAGVRRVKVNRPTREARRFRSDGFVLAVCNSKLVAWWYRQTYSDGLGVNPNHVKAIPLPKALVDIPPREGASLVSGCSPDSLRGEPPEALEGIVGECGTELQTLGDSLARECAGFVAWLERELGDGVGKEFRQKAVEQLEALDERHLVSKLERIHKAIPLAKDPRLRETQEIVLREFRSTKSKLADIRRRMGDLDALAERGIHLLFGLSEADSREVLGGSTDPPAP